MNIGSGFCFNKLFDQVNIFTDVRYSVFLPNQLGNSSSDKIQTKKQNGFSKVNNDNCQS